MVIMVIVMIAKLKKHANNYDTIGKLRNTQVYVKRNENNMFHHILTFMHFEQAAE